MRSINSRVRSCLKELLNLAICFACVTGLQIALSGDAVEQGPPVNTRRRPEVVMPRVRASADDVDQLFAEISQLRQEVRRVRELLEGQRSLPREEQEPPQARDGKAAGPILLYFHARWCGPCQQVNPMMARLKREGLPIRSVDIDAERPLVNQYGVTSIPCVVKVIEGQEADRLSGIASESQVRELLRQRNVRSDRVRAVTEHRGQVSDQPLKSFRPAGGLESDADAWRELRSRDEARD